MSGSNSLEIEIHQLFQEDNSIEFVCSELIGKYEKSEVLSATEIEGLSHFLISCGRFDLLNKLYLRCIEKDKLSQFPVGFLIEAIKEQNLEISHEIIDVVDQILEHQPFNTTALQSPFIQLFSAQIARELSEFIEKYKSELLQQKTTMIEQLNHFRQAGLHEQEDQMLKQLLRHFPQDIEVSLLKQAYLEKKADDILNRVATKKEISKKKFQFDLKNFSEDFLIKTSEQLLEIADRLKQTQPDQLYNLALLTFQIERFETALSIIEKAPSSIPVDWFKAETLLQCGRYLDLLNWSEQLEKKYASNSETFHSTTYYKAHCYYELGQKALALHHLENLVQIAPYFRSAESLLEDWRHKS